MVAVSQALVCYECDSSEDDACNDEYTPSASHETTCEDLLSDGCSKLKTKSKALGFTSITGVMFIHIFMFCLCYVVFSNSVLSSKKLTLLS